MLVCRQTQRLTFLSVDQAAQEATGSRPITVRAQHRVEQVAVSVDGSIEVAPTAADFDVGLVHVPRTPCSSTTFVTKTLTDQRGEPELPRPDGSVADLETSLHQQLGHIAKTELVAQAPEKAIKTMSVGNWRSLQGEPVRSLKRPWQDLQEKVL